MLGERTRDRWRVREKEKTGETQDFCVHKSLRPKETCRVSHPVYLFGLSLSLSLSHCLHRVCTAISSGKQCAAGALTFLLHSISTDDARQCLLKNCAPDWNYFLGVPPCVPPFLFPALLLLGLPLILCHVVCVCVCVSWMRHHFVHLLLLFVHDC